MKNNLHALAQLNFTNKKLKEKNNAHEKSKNGQIMGEDAD